jgi:hypothetical protein
VLGCFSRTASQGPNPYLNALIHPMADRNFTLLPVKEVQPGDDDTMLVSWVYVRSNSGPNSFQIHVDPSNSVRSLHRRETKELQHLKEVEPG